MSSLLTQISILTRKDKSLLGLQVLMALPLLFGLQTVSFELFDNLPPLRHHFLVASLRLLHPLYILFQLGVHLVQPLQLLIFFVDFFLHALRFVYQFVGGSLGLLLLFHALLPLPSQLLQLLLFLSNCVFQCRVLLQLFAKCKFQFFRLALGVFADGFQILYLLVVLDENGLLDVLLLFKFL